MLDSRSVVVMVSRISCNKQLATAIQQHWRQHRIIKWDPASGFNVHLTAQHQSAGLNILLLHTDDFAILRAPIYSKTNMYMVMFILCWRSVYTYMFRTYSLCSHIFWHMSAQTFANKAKKNFFSICTCWAWCSLHLHTIFSVYKKFWPDISTRWKVTESPESPAWDHEYWQFQQYTVLWTEVLDWPIHITFHTLLIWQKPASTDTFTQHTKRQYIIKTPTLTFSGLSIRIEHIARQ